jgi:NAD-dependent SIR2 family protein deacetylase
MAGQGITGNSNCLEISRPRGIQESAGTALLAGLLSGRRHLWVLSGAGISAASGFPTYRDHDRNWQHRRPIQHEDFVKKFSTRQKYWARSMVGWQQVKSAKPNAAHLAVTRLQQCGRLNQLVTQNVDCLHSIAGTRGVIDLHGRLDQVVCLDCKSTSSRFSFQERLEEQNPDLAKIESETLPDGDAQIENRYLENIKVPQCLACNGTIMPDIVLFGGRVPKPRVEKAYASLTESDGVLVLGSSLSVYSGFRFIKWAHENGIPLFAVNQGKMRGSEWFDQIAREPCETALPVLAENFDRSGLNF